MGFTGTNQLQGAVIDGLPEPFKIRKNEIRPLVSRQCSLFGFRFAPRIRD